MGDVGLVVADLSRRRDELDGMRRPNWFDGDAGFLGVFGGCELQSTFMRSAVRIVRRSSRELERSPCLVQQLRSHQGLFRLRQFRMTENALGDAMNLAPADRFRFGH